MSPAKLLLISFEQLISENNLRK